MTTQEYADLITSEHRNKPRFVATVEMSVSPFAKIQEVLRSLPEEFDIDTATGVQLDTIGIWVGRSRYIGTPITGVYFEWDNVNTALGWEGGIWKDPFDPAEGLTTLPDDSYRLLLKAKIAANYWDGTIPGAYAIWENIFTGSYLIIEDLQDMTMAIGVSGMPMSTLDTQLLERGYLPIKPAGVRIRDYAVVPVAGVLFSWDMETSAAFGGWEIGNWTNY
jgi:hypothetical protein